jgi:hypothetical protein
MNKEELIKEIMRVKEALAKTNSPYLKRDYGKYLKRLYRDLKYYDKNMKRWQTQN